MAKEKMAAPTNERWNAMEKPFDLATCKLCATQHVYHHYICHDPNHNELKFAVRKALADAASNPSNAWLKKHYRQIVAIRRKFSACWE